ncbi:hypothetical protein ACFXNW_28565 [Nocardia sp. NPDC059180]|uniref:hypothetical protein n=1 Tax=Nocardia sp. NPDC059180 TaxID=3346761 RepID=UPI0036A8DAE0
MRTVALGFACVALMAQGIWLWQADATLGSITAGGVIAVGALTLTLGRARIVTAIVRIVLGLLLLGSVADRFGLFGAAGTDGVSWGSFTAFVDYTRTLLPDPVRGLTSAAAVAATALEIILGAALVAGIRTRIVATGTTGLLIIFAVAMWSALGFDAMADYAVPVLAAGAAVIATCTPARAPHATSAPKLASAEAV